MSLAKKLERAQQEGYDEGYKKGYDEALREVLKDQRKVWVDGIRVGTEHATDKWVQVIENTKGIGPTLKERILQEIKNLTPENTATPKEDEIK